MPPEVCFLCEASKGAEQDMYRCYTDVSDSASYWQTLCQTNPWAIAPQLCFLLGFSHIYGSARLATCVEFTGSANDVGQRPTGNPQRTSCFHKWRFGIQAC